MEIYKPAEDTRLLEKTILGIRAGRVLDMGTGTGVLAITLSKTCKEILAVDVNPAAIAAAKKNAVGISNIEFRVSDLFSKVSGKFDLIVWNMPYLPFETDVMYSCGVDARLLKDFFVQAKNHLDRNGRMIFLVSSLTPLSEKEIIAFGYSVKELARTHISFEDLIVYQATSVERIPKAKSL